MLCVGVVGAGVIGSGVALCACLRGHQVRLVDDRASQLEGSLAGMARQLRFRRFFGLDDSQDASRILGRVQSATSLELLSECSVVVENITEDWALKAELYPLFDRFCPQAMLAANTSALPIAELGSLLARPERLVGIHFMNPVHLNGWVELIEAPSTSPATLSQAHDFLESLGKQWVSVKDGAGFVSNRVLMLTLNEAIRVLDEGRAEADGIDRLFRGCFGHAEGPLATADLIGLDTVLNTLEILAERVDPQRFEPAPRLRAMVAAGRLGRKSGKGFFEYEN
ncbi:MAG: 3-hydroxyacyl-CoA dehydrogenase family protein [Vulcanimicrobiota bacterium]